MRAVLKTERLILREWRDDDLDAFAAMGQDREVMASFPSLVTREQSEAVIARLRAHQARAGFCLWAVEAPGVAPFIGFTGLARPAFTAPFTPCIEIGWRLARAYWGMGYAVEGARAALAFAFDTIGADEVVAFLIPSNARSESVCRRLGMLRDLHGDFDHPMIPEDAISVAGHPQRRHLLYRIGRPEASVAKVGPPKT
jgi:RimJ/RimL family protein N-acetyltransferase